MNILFLTIVGIEDISERGIYTDLMRNFRDARHNVYIACPKERRYREGTTLKNSSGVQILSIKTLNLQKTNIIEKGLGTIALEYQFLSAIRKHFSEVKFDLIIYSTPPITFSKVIAFIKKRDKAYSYLLLKDIFPQNAIDMRMIRKGSFIHKFFQKKEKELYQLSDTIGCMSEANKDYINRHHPHLNGSKVEVNPNSIQPIEVYVSSEERTSIRGKYGLPTEKMIFVYGGNLGKPQGVDFLMETIDKNLNTQVFFLVIGSGTEFNRISHWFKEKQPNNAILYSGLSKKDYDEVLSACDVGLIFLHKDFTIPNFPSRLLSYLEMSLPIIAATDESTDIGTVIEENNCGFWVHASDINRMNDCIDRLQKAEDFEILKQNARKLLQENYTVNHSYHLIVQKINV